MALLSLARLLFVLSFRAAYPLGAPLLLGVLVVASVIFGPTGMRAQDLTQAMRASVPIAIAIWGGWILLSLPVVRLSLLPSSAMYLRWLPVPRAFFSFCFALVTLLFELPLLALFFRGEGALSALSAAFSVLALHALLLCNRYRLWEVVAGLLALVSLGPAPFFLTIPAGFAAACFSVSSAVATAPELGSGPRRGVLGKSAIGALASTYMLYVLRVEPASLLRTLVLSGLAALAFPLVVRGYDLETDASFAALGLGLAAASFPTGLSSVAAAVMRAERGSTWLCDSNGLLPADRARAATLATSIMAMVFGFGYAALIAIVFRGHFNAILRIFLLAPAYAIATAMVLSLGAREADASPKRGDRAMIYALVWTAFSIALANGWSATAILPLVGVGFVMGFLSERRAFLLRARKGTS